MVSFSSFTVPHRSSLVIKAFHANVPGPPWLDWYCSAVKELCFLPGMDGDGGDMAEGAYPNRKGN
jgi:hypothetical protein